MAKKKHQFGLPPSLEEVGLELVDKIAFLLSFTLAVVDPFLEQPECVRCESEFFSRNRQALAPFHGRLLCIVARLPQRAPTRLVHDNVIQDVDLEKLPGPDQITSDFDVGFRG